MKSIEERRKAFEVEKEKIVQRLSEDRSVLLSIANKCDPWSNPTDSEHECETKAAEHLLNSLFERNTQNSHRWLRLLKTFDEYNLSDVRRLLVNDRDLEGEPFVLSAFCITFLLSQLYKDLTTECKTDEEEAVKLLQEGSFNRDLLVRSLIYSFDELSKEMPSVFDKLELKYRRLEDPIAAANKLLDLVKALNAERELYNALILLSHKLPVREQTPLKTIEDFQRVVVTHQEALSTSIIPKFYSVVKLMKTLSGDIIELNETFRKDPKRAVDTLFKVISEYGMPVWLDFFTSLYQNDLFDVRDLFLSDQELRGESD